MKILEYLLGWIQFLCVAAVVTVAPWLFAAWEKWIFWPFTALIFLSTFLLAVRILLRAASTREDPDDVYATYEALENSRLKILAVAAALLFLGYALARFLAAEVFLDAERSFLLHLTAFLLGLQVVFGFSRRQLKGLFVLLLANLFLLGLYGVFNHVGWRLWRLVGVEEGSAGLGWMKYVGWHSRFVLWRPGYEQYLNEGRASGSYFCPDHFSGAMELAFALALALLLDRERGWRWKLFAGLLAALAVLGVILSKSRGGGLTLAVLLIAALAIGFSQWPRLVRWYWRMTVVSLTAVVFIGFLGLNTGYMKRFRDHFNWDQVRTKSLAAKTAAVKKALEDSSRGQMYSAAIRAWDTRLKTRWFGIGPGMHLNVWPHFAPSPDGNREREVWPTHLNNTFHSFEVHSDWIQLLEEYGMAGVGLFLVFVAATGAILAAGFRREVESRAKHDWNGPARGYHAWVLAALLAAVAMGFHSFGDFNLQMPATAWMLATLAALPMALILDSTWEDKPPLKD